MNISSRTTNMSPRYRRVYDAVRDTPETATRIYYRWAGLPEWKALTRHRRHERKWLAKALENLADDGLLRREVTEQEGRTCVVFHRTIGT